MNFGGFGLKPTTSTPTATLPSRWAWSSSYRWSSPSKSSGSPLSACRPTAQERRARTTRVLQRTSQVKDSGHRPMRVLLVEDNPGDARLLQESLSEAGDGAFELIHAGRLSEGLEYLCGSEFDIVLLDLSLPDSQGLETFSTTQATAPQVAIVVLTGLADDVLAAAARGRGPRTTWSKGRWTPTCWLAPYGTPPSASGPRKRCGRARRGTAPSSRTPWTPSSSAGPTAGSSTPIRPRWTCSASPVGRPWPPAWGTGTPTPPTGTGSGTRWQGPGS